MKNIEILDCTLRDGGYINNWNFNQNVAKNIIKNLQNAHIDYIEAGFLTNKNSKGTLFDDIAKIKNILPDGAKNIYIMLNYGDYDIDKIPNKKNTPLEGIRLIFKKENANNALNYASNLIKKGYSVFINPTYINSYTRHEIKNLIKNINSINPYALSIVDTLGILDNREISQICENIQELNYDIKLCFHSHDNIQLAFLNAIDLINKSNKNLIIDTTLYAMGRGAGNIQSELMAKYLNDNYNKNYDIDLIIKTIDDYIIPIFNKTPWGYCYIYEICAKNLCHINYAKYLIEKNITDDKTIEKIFKKIPQNKKINFDEKTIAVIIENC